MVEGARKAGLPKEVQQIGEGMVRDLGEEKTSLGSLADDSGFEGGGQELASELYVGGFRPLVWEFKTHPAKDSIAVDLGIGQASALSEKLRGEFSVDGVG